MGQGVPVDVEARGRGLDVAVEEHVVIEGFEIARMVLVVIGPKALVVDVMAVMEFLLTDEGHEVEREESREIESRVLGPEEQGDVLGGQFIPASAPKFKHRLRAFIDWEILQCEKAGVVFKLNHLITPDSEELSKADRIIMATGASPSLPHIPGIDKALEVCDAHVHPEKIHGKKIVVCGGGISGCDMALELAMDGKDVTIVEMQSELCPTALLDNRNPLMFRLRDNHVKQLTSTKIKEITDKGVVAENKDGEIKLDADLVIAAFGTHPNKEYVDAICEKYPTTLVIGDCVKVGQVAEAVRGGYFAAYSLR